MNINLLNIFKDLLNYLSLMVREKKENGPKITKKMMQFFLISVWAIFFNIELYKNICSFETLKTTVHAQSYFHL